MYNRGGYNCAGFNSSATSDLGPKKYFLSSTFPIAIRNEVILAARSTTGSLVDADFRFFTTIRAISRTDSRGAVVLDTSIGLDVISITNSRTESGIDVLVQLSPRLYTEVYLRLDLIPLRRDRRINTAKRWPPVNSRHTSIRTRSTPVGSNRVANG